MRDRKEKIERLLSDLGALKRIVAGKDGHSAHPDITPAQWGILMHVERVGESSVKDIASALHMTSSAVTQLVDVLVKHRLVVRKTAAADRRRVTLTLSPTATKHIQTTRRQAVRKFSAVFEILGDTDFDKYCALTTKIVAAASRRGRNG